MLEIIVSYADDRSRKRRAKIITFKADPELAEKLDKAAETLGISRSELIREAVTIYIKEVVEGGYCGDGKRKPLSTPR